VTALTRLCNRTSLARADLARFTPAELTAACVARCRAGARLVALAPLPAEGGRLDLLAVLADDQGAALELGAASVAPGEEYPALTAALPQAQAFERELFEEHGIRPAGHPWLKPLRRRAELEPAGAAPPYDFFRVEGAGLHEVAVGPVHAGIIEPGHFRFQCHGETVLSLEIQLGFQRRGAEALLVAGPPARRLAVAESLAGDTAVGHAFAYCAALEALAGLEAPLGAQVLRGVALELERTANHVGDLGALAGDVGYLPAASWLGGLRGDVLNVSLALSGSRFGRGLLTPGGVRFGLTAERGRELDGRLARLERHLTRTLDVMLGTASVISRFENTGTVPRALADDLGLVGPAARASGCDRDVRQDHPAGVYRFAHIPVARADSGDVLGRALVRALEAQRSLTFVREHLRELPQGPLTAPLPPLAPDAVAVALIEGWRGEIAHVAATGADGQLAAYKVVDPSFHNWFGLAIALRGNQISDFPLCNKSFNLSYAGHDL
jgi:Ni,Fe-hydrogenase III large subunit